MKNKPTEVQLTMTLQLELEKMSKKEFKQYMKGKVLVYEGKKYGFKKEDKTTDNRNDDTIPVNLEQ